MRLIKNVYDLNYVLKISFSLKFVNIVQGNGSSCWTQTQIANNGNFKFYIKNYFESRADVIVSLVVTDMTNSLVLTSPPTDISSYRDTIELKFYNHQCFNSLINHNKIL